MRMKANYVEKPSNFIMDDWQIEKVVELSHEDFFALKTVPCQPQPFIAENKNCMFHKDGIIHGLLALGQGGHDGILIDAEGYDYARIAASVPGARDIVNAQLDRAVARIVQEATEYTSDGNWQVSFDTLEDQFGLNIQVGNGLDSMLHAALKHRPEVASVDMHDGCIEMSCRPEYCRQLKENAGHELLLKELLPLLKENGLMFLCHEEAEQSVLVENLRRLTDAGREDHAALFNARVSQISETSEGTEIVLTDVNPEELVRFNEACDAFMEAEQAMGPTM